MGKGKRKYLVRGDYARDEIRTEVEGNMADRQRNTEINIG